MSFGAPLDSTLSISKRTFSRPEASLGRNCGAQWCRTLSARTTGRGGVGISFNRRAKILRHISSMVSLLLSVGLGAGRWRLPPRLPRRRRLVSGVWIWPKSQWGLGVVSGVKGFAVGG